MAAHARACVAAGAFVVWIGAACLLGVALGIVLAYALAYIAGLL